MSEEAAAHPAPPHAGPAVNAAPATETSERIFRRRLVKSLSRFDIKDLRAMWKEELLEPHMHLFLMLVIAFALGVLIFVAEPSIR